MIDEKKIDTDLISGLNKTIREIRGDMRGFFADLTWSNGETNITLDQVNDLLDLIGMSKLKRKFSGTVVFAFNFSDVEADNEDDIKQVLEDSTEIIFDYEHDNVDTVNTPLLADK